MVEKPEMVTVGDLLLSIVTRKSKKKKQQKIKLLNNAIIKKKQPFIHNRRVYVICICVHEYVHDNNMIM